MSNSKTYQKEVDAGKLSEEITEVSSLSDLSGLTTRIVSGVHYVDVLFDSSKTSLEWAECDQLVTDHDLVSLDDLKKLKNMEIDRRTVELIDEGYTHDSEQFSLSDNAQRNWIGISALFSNNILNSISALDPNTATVADVINTINGTITALMPRDVTTYDDGEYIFNSFSDYKDFYNTGLATVQSHYDSGRVLKLQVNAATNAAGVDAVTDNR